MSAVTVLLLAGGARAAVITVTTTADDNTPNDGSVSLREAIQAINNGTAGADTDISNQNPGTFGVNDTIKFDISADQRRQTIDVGATGNGALPALTKPVTIDGYTEPDASANTLVNGDNANVLIALDGANAGPNADGILVSNSGGDSAIRGLDIFDFSLNQIELQGESDLVAGDFLGYDSTGAPTRSPVGAKISNSDVNVIGGTTPADRNVISGNLMSGVDIVGNTSAAALANVVEGNFIGTDPSGRVADGNALFPPNNVLGAVQISGGILNTIGGSTFAAHNVISGNGAGVDIRNGGEFNIVEGNYIGVSADATSPLPNAGFGVHVGSDDNLAPPAGPGQTNEPASARNIIGLDPNTNFSGLGNLIADNGGDGVQIDGSVPPNNATPTENSGNSVLGNSIYNNGGLAIDLKTGPGFPLKPNNLLPAPTITSVTPQVSTSMVHGTVSAPSSPGMTVRVELFGSPMCANPGPGQAQRFIGAATATTNSSGQASFSAGVPLLAPNTAVSATMTNTSPDPSTPSGSANEFDTSEVSTCFAVPLRSTTTSARCAPASALLGQTVTCTATVADSAPGTPIAPTGSVSFSVNGSLLPGGCVLKGGSCTATYKPTATGTNTVTAGYGGDSAHTVSSGSASESVLPFTVKNLKVSESGKISFDITVPGAGEITATISAPHHVKYARLKLKVKRAETKHVSISPTGSGHHGSHGTFELSVTFKPAGAQSHTLKFHVHR